MDRNIDCTCSSAYIKTLSIHLFNLSVYLSIVKTKQKKQSIKLNLFYSIISTSSGSPHLYRKVLPCAYPGLKKHVCARHRDCCAEIRSMKK